MDIVLATTSPYRKEAFGFLKIPFITQGSGVDENEFKTIHRDDPEALVLSLAKTKAEAVAVGHKDAIVLGFDSVGVFEGKFFDKPKTRQEAFDRLKQVSGKKYDFFTGIRVINTKSHKTLSRIVKTIVYFRNFSDEEINNYLDEDELYKTHAGAFNSLDHYSASFASRIEGSPHNLLHGIPLDMMPDILKEMGA